MKNLVAKPPYTNGIHFLVELSGCDRSILDDAAGIESILVKSVEVIDTSIVSSFFHQFRPDGVTGCVMLLDAHITIHTWPGTRYASVDLYASPACDLQRIQTILVEGLRASEPQSLLVERGQPAPEKMRVHGHRRVASYILDCRGNLIPDSVFVEKSPGRGFGLFAARDFSIGELIYNSSATLTEWDAEYVVKTDLGKSLHDADSLGYELHLPLIDMWPEQVRHTLARHYDIQDMSSTAILKCVTGEGEREVLITGFDGLINHSDNPNVTMEWSDAKVKFDEEGNPIWEVPTRAVRRISIGEELFVDYRISLFDFVPPADWLP
ncbi:MAG: adenosylmethionine decarboxylase [Hyphomicrobiales bacterium]|nr:adenosylmethionine decarboxylase [Hyphomicrobiales bacterium]